MFSVHGLSEGTHSMLNVRRPVGVLIAAIAAIVPATSVFAAPAAHPSTILYKSLVASPGNLPSIGFEATQAFEFGNQISLTRSARIATVIVTMSSWACQSGSWSAHNCATAPGSKFNEPITLNIYQAPATNPSTQPDSPGSGLPGAKIVTVTKTFSIPFRPSANNTKCVGSEAGDWFDSKLGACFAGLANNITFSLSSLKLTLPQAIVFGIAYNTSDYGAVPYGDATACHATAQGCGYDSLNVGLTQDPDNLSKGADPYPGTVYWNTQTAANYCDNGGAGTGTFRFDSPSTTPCWGVSGPPYTTAPWYIPAVQFTSG
jgi:hypothetical protein